MSGNDEKSSLGIALEAAGLPFPMPTRWDNPVPELIREYIRRAVQVVTHPGLEPYHCRSFAAAVLEHLSVQYRDLWDEMVAAYFAAPSGIWRKQFCYWLMCVAGSSKEYVEKVLQVVLQEDPAYIWEFTPWLVMRVNQQQWDRLAPMLADPVVVERNVNFVRRKKAQLEKKGVVPWIPGVEL